MARFRKLSTSASRLAVGPQARHRSSSASWEACSGTSSSCCRCPRRFGDDVLCKDWAALTDADWERIDRCGWQQTSYVKLHFDEHEVFTSLYFLELGRTAEQLQRAAHTLLQGAGYGHILRIKGFIPDRGGWLELNAARDAMTLQPIPNGQEVLIVIGEGLDKAAIEAVVKQL